MTADPLAVIRRIRETPPAPRPRAGERCEMCTEPIPDEHNHLVDVVQRNLMCTCRGCWLLFTPQGAGGGHFKAVPERYAAFPDLHLSPAQWDSLQIPVSVAFFFVNSTLGRVCAFYPSPAGATESLLPLDTWDELTATHAELSRLEPDVEAFLVRFDRRRPRASAISSRSTPATSSSASCARCGTASTAAPEAHAALDAFFDDVRAKAR